MVISAQLARSLFYDYRCRFEIAVFVLNVCNLSNRSRLLFLFPRDLSCIYLCLDHLCCFCTARLFFFSSYFDTVFWWWFDTLLFDSLLFVCCLFFRDGFVFASTLLGLRITDFHWLLSRSCLMYVLLNDFLIYSSVYYYGLFLSSVFVGNMWNPPRIFVFLWSIFVVLNEMLTMTVLPFTGFFFFSFPFSPTYCLL